MGSGHKRIFLSAVTSEFGSYRPEMAGRLNRPNVDVKVQEDFLVSGGTTLEKLDDYIRQCDAVIHLVGDATGSFPPEWEVQRLMARYPDIVRVLPPISAALGGRGPGISYTQWESYLAIYHGRDLFVYRASSEAPRSTGFAPDVGESAVQEKHFARLCALGKDRGRFDDVKDLVAQVLRDLLDFLTFSEPAKASLTGWLFGLLKRMTARLDRWLFDIHRQTRPSHAAVPVADGVNTFWFALFFRMWAVVQALSIIWAYYFQLEDGTLHGLQQTMLLYVSAGVGLFLTGWQRLPRRAAQLSRMIRAGAWRDRKRELAARGLDLGCIPIELTCFFATAPIAAMMWLENAVPAEWMTSLALIVPWQLWLGAVQIIRHWPVYRRFGRGLLRRNPPGVALAISWFVGVWFLFNPLLLPTGASATFRAAGDEVLGLAADDASQEVAVVSRGPHVSSQLDIATTIEFIATPQLAPIKASLERVPWDAGNFVAIAFRDRSVCVARDYGELWRQAVGFSLWSRKETWQQYEGPPLAFTDFQIQSARLDEFGRILVWGVYFEPKPTMSEHADRSADNQRGIPVLGGEPGVFLIGWSNGAGQSFSWIDSEWSRQQAGIAAVAVSADGTRLAVAGRRLPQKEADGSEWVIPALDFFDVPTLALFDTSNNNPIWERELTGGFILDSEDITLTFSRDGKRLLRSSNGESHAIFDSVSGQCVQTTGTLRGTMIWSPDNTRFALLRAHRLELYDALNGERTATYIVPRGAYRCHAFSADGRQVLAGGDQGLVWSYPVK